MGWIRLNCGAVAEAQHFLNRARQMTRKQGFLYWYAVATALHSQTLLVGEGTALKEAAINEAREGAKVFARLGARLVFPSFLVAVARTQAHAGRLADALQQLEDALAMAADPERPQPLDFSEIYRLKGELLAAGLAPHEDVCRWLLKAADCAREFALPRLGRGAQEALARHGCAGE